MFQHKSFVFVHGIAALPRLARHWLTELCLPLFTYYLANRRMVSYLLTSIFKLKLQTICNVYSIIQESWNIQASKCLTFTLVYTWWHHQCPGMFWNILVLRDATRDATLLLFWLWSNCVVYWNENVPNLRAQQTMMQSKISSEIFIVNRY